MSIYIDNNVANLVASIRNMHRLLRITAGEIANNNFSGEMARPLRAQIEQELENWKPRSNLYLDLEDVD